MTQGRRERADAARNRRAILSATEDLLTRFRPEEISMEQVATAAGVGKGTLFHRFGSRMGLMTALMQERALSLGESVTSGPPPLGPGAPPRERLFAFLDGVIDVVSRNKGLLAALGHAASTAHRPAARQRPAAVGNGDGNEGGNGDGNGTRADSSGSRDGGDGGRPHPHDGHPVYAFWYGHISALIAEERPDLDADVLAHVLLSTLQSEQIQFLLEEGAGARVTEALRLVAAGILASPEKSSTSG
ncbi:TetR/AcrR family transcriptional regulator [Streptomyces sp. TS71-3]|uniref:TetR/AcrR family transcriptional regulator n=1 Tax=Streptomyces sp. TS71-3 TaxID=2733862 RepID=UPI001B0B4EE4|nr:TetR/AcrR family transcriptional regulator [Streptomyces sp. TS71-3]GHJ34430.1 TetR family transcriptional regulator [Streptomyces sp. TS71-3]